MKKALTIQDISCVGKCSLTVALPIISACGVETAVIPTAVLSTHTAFNGFTFFDLTDEIEKISKHWQKENINFDSIYTGYLGSEKQINIIKNIFKQFKNDNNFILIDPVMGDNGQLYKGFNQEFADKMAKLCSFADVIVPNFTEASFMLHEELVKPHYEEEEVKHTLIKLCKLGVKKAVLTGVSLIGKENLLGVYAYDSEKNEFYSYYREKLPQSFHGTGDVFASSLTGALTLGKDFFTSLKIAVDFTVESIIKTMENENHNWYGVDFESAFPHLINLLK